MTLKRLKKEDYQSYVNAVHYEGYYLQDIYGRCSYNKERAWRYCFEKYCNTDDCHGFGITSHNTFQFTVQWFGTYTDEQGNKYKAIFKETANNSYIYYFA